MAKAKENEDVEVLFVWETASPDPIQYKPYNPTLSPAGVWVAVQVPAEYVVRVIRDASNSDPFDNRLVILTPAGMAYCLEEVSSAIMRLKSNPPAKRS